LTATYLLKAQYSLLTVPLNPNQSVYLLCVGWYLTDSLVVTFAGSAGSRRYAQSLRCG